LLVIIVDRVAEPDRVDASGLHIWRDGADGVEIASVDPNSPASAAGLKAGDRILRYDGKGASSISLFKLRTLFATEGLKLRLEVENTAGRREITLELTRSKNDKDPMKKTGK
jgi:C-terminal processing protease CtpA/Prc